ncbi:MAG: hypothetical protein ABDI20_03310 [Candidatus Bipolaricaulaceae bacterium]
MERRGFKAIFPEDDPCALREQLAQVLLLGLGPTGRLLPTYIPRPEEEEIRRYLEDKQYWAVIITGPPVAGKTRTMIEVTVNLAPHLILIWDRNVASTPMPSDIKLPTRKVVLLVDDLTIRPEENSLPEPITSLRLRCPNLSVLGTARSERLPQDVRKARIVRLTEVPQDKLFGLAHAVAKAEGRTLQDILRRYNGHPGALVAGLDAMRQRFDNLAEELAALGMDRPARRAELGRAFLESSRLLWEMGVRTLSLERVWTVVQKVFHENPEAMEREEVPVVLAKLQFLRLAGNIVRFYEGILLEALPDLPERDRLAQEIWTVLRAQEDAVAFKEIGDSWNEEYSPAYQRDPRGALRQAIAAYDEVLRVWTPEEKPLEYAMTQNNLGTAYERLAAHEDPVANLKLAIGAYKEALHFYTPQAAPLDYAMTQNNLGNAYSELAAHEDPVANLKLAIGAYKEALHFYTPQAAPLDYAMTQNNLGNAYARLAAHEDPVANLKRAIGAYEEALRFYTPEVAPLRHAEVKQSLQELLQLACRLGLSLEDENLNFHTG